MKERLVKVAHRVDALSLRERLFVFAAGIFIVGGLWEAVLAGPLTVREARANEQVKALQERLEQLDTSLATAAAGMSEGVPAELDRLRALRERVATTDEELRVFATDLVTPKEMRAALEELLSRQKGLTLLSAVNRPARALVADDAEADPAARTESVESEESAAPRLYRHSLVLTLEGSFLDCLAYLRSVERLPWQIYWSRFELTGDEYPVNAIVIELTTLSLDEEWIGV